jgi:hypothetical protein
MRTIAVISLVFLFFILSMNDALPVSLNDRFPTVQKHYTGGGVERFGQYWGAGDRPVYEFNGDGIGDLLLVVDDTMHIMYGTSAGGFTLAVKTNVKLVPDLWYNQYIVLDENGDGLDDILTSGIMSFGVKLNQGNGTFESTGIGSDVFQYYLNCWFFGTGYFMMHPTASLDCNADGYDDLLAYPMMGDDPPECGPCVSYIFERNAGDGFDAADTGDGGCEYEWDFHHRHFVTTGDFDGDGHTDVLQGRYYAGGGVIKIGPGCQFSPWEQDPYLPFFPGAVRVGDFNGDGCDDFADQNFEEQLGIHVCYGDPDQITCQYYPSWGDPVWGDAYLACVADFDADGYDDVAVQVDRLGTDGIWEVYVHYSEGSTFLDRSDTLCLHGSNFSEQSFAQMYSSDFNSDGRDDLLYFVAPDTIGVLIQQGPIATFLQDFTVRLEGLSAAWLEWEVSSPADCEAFRVSRSAEGGFFTRIASIAADPLQDTYSYTDNTILGLSGSDVIYRLEAALIDGSTEILAEQTVAVPRAELALHQNYPNPFNPGTVLSFILPERASVTLDIYDVSGRLVRRLVNGEEMEAGPREIFWDGANEAGRPVSSGVYYCRLCAGKETVNRKLVLAR